MILKEMKHNLHYFLEKKKNRNLKHFKTWSADIFIQSVKC